MFRGVSDVLSDCRERRHFFGACSVGPILHGWSTSSALRLNEGGNKILEIGVTKMSLDWPLLNPQAIPGDELGY